MAYQKTLAGPAVCAGIGVHTGERARLVLKPAKANTGIVFVRTDITDKDNEIKAIGTNVTTVQLGTTLANEAGVTVSTVEHLLAACSGLCIDNLVIEIDGPEMPIMDGSSSLYCQLMKHVGIKELKEPRRRLRILKPIEVVEGDKFARLIPSKTVGAPFELRVRIEFDSAAIGEQSYTFKLTPGAFARDLAFARTFGFTSDFEKLKSMGLARGASMDNTVALEGDKILNPEGLHVADEFVRHKILDAIGDIFLAGGAIAGVFEGDRPGHAINNKLVRALLADTSAWEWVSDEVRVSEPAPMYAAGLKKIDADMIAPAVF